MRSMIYYPGFEVQKDEWLKFALLYFEELRPIIPYMSVSDDKYLSTSAIHVMQNTNLIRPYQPEYNEGCCASILACEDFDKYLANPQRYSTVFNRYGKTNLVEKWQSKNFQTCSLYDGKFSRVFYDYCVENGLAHPFEHGIKISKDLAFVYMSLLADIISKRHEIEMFTDINCYNDFLLSKDRCMSVNQEIRYKIIKTQMEFVIPARIKDIPLETIIQLRSNRDFDSCRRAYVKEMEKYLEKRKEVPDCSFEEQLKLKRELKKILELTGNAVASVVLSCATVASLLNGMASPTQALASAYLDYSTIKQVYGLPKYIKGIGSKIQAKRYVGHIRKSI